MSGSRGVQRSVASARGEEFRETAPGVRGVTGNLPSPLLGSCKIRDLKGEQGGSSDLLSELMVRWSLLMSFFVAAPNQTVMEEQRMDSMTAV